MALQQLTIQGTSETAWLNKSAVSKIACLFVAGLLFTAMLYNKATNNSQPTCTPVSKAVSEGTGNGANTKGTQSREASPTFSLMPGGLSRFLQ